MSFITSTSSTKTTNPSTEKVSAALKSLSTSISEMNTANDALMNNTDEDMKEPLRQSAENATNAYLTELRLAKRLFGHGRRTRRHRRKQRKTLRRK